MACRSEESAINSLDPGSFMPGTRAVIDEALPMGHIIIELALVCDGVVEVVDNPLTFLLTLLIISLEA